MSEKSSGDPTGEGLLSGIFASTGSWALVLGVTGLVCGFFGPMVFSPDANQGPMLGLFITGPGGAVLGAILGFVVRAARLPKALAAKMLPGVAAIFAAVCLYYSMPEPSFYANVVDAEIVSCAPPASMKDKAFEDWEHRIEKVTWAPPRAGWKEDFERMVQADPGVALEVRVLRERKLYQNRKPWNRGTFLARPWGSGNAPTHYFARYSGASCERYPTGHSAIYLATGETAKLWPAEVLSNFLDLQVVEPLPARFGSVVAQ
jgi:hypothetical protein